MTQQVDIILRGDVVVTMNGNGDVFSPGAVAIQGVHIVAVGPEDVIMAEHSAAEVVDCTGHAIVPGLVNCHTHVPMSLFRGLADDLRLDVWLLGYMMPVEREFVRPDFCRIGTLLSAAEMIRSGTTCFNDMYYFEDSVAEAVDQAGLRAILGQTIVKFPSPDAQSYEEAIGYCRSFIERWRGHPRITPAVAPHAPYTCTAQILRDASALAVECDVPLHIHLSETALEVEENKREQGMPPVQWVEQLGLFEGKVIAAHCVHVNDAEIGLLARHKVGVSHNPTSNLKLASGFAPVAKLRQAGVALGIGTDGCASNNDQDMFEEMRLAALLPKAMQGDPTLLPARDAFAMATIDGARALHLDHLIGSLEPGKHADIVVVSLESPHLTPRFALGTHNIYSHLVYSAKGSDVRDVLVDGRFLMRDRTLLTINITEVMAEARKLARQINDFIDEREHSLLNKLIALGSPEWRETFEIQVKAHLPGTAGVEARLKSPAIEIVRATVREQYDTYFLFHRPDMGSIRYREDEILQGQPEEGAQQTGVLQYVPEYTLTLIGPQREREYERSVILSRSRFTAKATHSLRFYREYFQPDMEHEIVKWRKRFRILYKGEEFAVNLDRLSKPAYDGAFLEIKSRTWSQADAMKKAALIGELLDLLGIPVETIVKGEYVTF